MIRSAVHAVLFDLDGTLVDSAPDLVAAAVALCSELEAPAPDREAIRRAVSAGGRAMLKRALPVRDDAAIDLLLPRFLDLYAERIAESTRLYEGIGDVLDQLDAENVPWGIVTNKPGWLTRPLLERLDLSMRCAALLTGDCLPVKKPHPAPVLAACAAIGIEPATAVMIGDDRRDIESGRAAGTRTLAAAWGYLDGGDPADWNADAIVAMPLDLLAHFGFAR